MRHKTLLQYSVLLLLLCFQVPMKGQEKFTFPSSNDLGLNITGLLSSFLGNSSTDLNPESFPFVVKLNRKHSAVRFGIGVDLKQSDDLIFNVEQVVFNNFQINTRVGFERKKYIGNKFGFFYGLDLVGQFRNREDVVSNNVDITTISENGYSFGGGPIYGFEYYLNKNFYLGAEGSFYTIYSYLDRTEQFNLNPSINAQKKSAALDAQISAPSRLYIMIRF